MVERPEQSEGIEHLLHQLNGKDAGTAWAAFIDRYSMLIMKVVCQFEYEQDRDSECFLYVCEKLCEQQFRRLQKFNVGGKAKFSHWLATVVFNLCVDWHRAAFGRASMWPAIAALPAFDQLVYRLCFEEGMTRESCFETIRADYPGTSIDHVSDALGRIFGLLTPRQRWQLCVRRQRRSHTHHDQVIELAERIPHPGPGPQATAIAAEESGHLKRALGRLPADQQLLLKLRFQEGLSYQRIATIEHLGDAHRARRRVQAALDALFIGMQRARSGQ